MIAYSNGIEEREWTSNVEGTFKFQGALIPNSPLYKRIWRKIKNLAEKSPRKFKLHQEKNRILNLEDIVQNSFTGNGYYYMVDLITLMKRKLKLI